MRALIIPVAWLAIVCTSSVAEDKATPEANSEVADYRIGYAVGHFYPKIVRAERHTLIFPAVPRPDHEHNRTKIIPYLLAVEHSDTLNVEPKFRVYEGGPSSSFDLDIFHQWKEWVSNVTLVTRTADTVLATRMRRSTHCQDGKSADGPAIMQGLEMQFIADDMPSEESLDFDLKNGRVFVIALGDRTRRTTIRQLRVDLVDDLQPLPGARAARKVPVADRWKSLLERRAKIVRWWKEVERKDLRTSSAVGSQTRGDVAAASVEEGRAISQRKQHIPGISAVEDKAPRDQTSAGPRFIEWGGSLRGNAGPFAVEAGQYTLVFPIIEITTYDDNMDSITEEGIPFLLAVKHEKAVPVISALCYSSGAAVVCGFVIDNTPPLAASSSCSYFLVWDDKTEPIEFYTEMMTYEERPLVLDLDKGRVFVISVDRKTKNQRIKQLQIDIFDPKTVDYDPFDPKTIDSKGGVKAIDKKIAALVSWWKSIDQSKVE